MCVCVAYIAKRGWVSLVLRSDSRASPTFLILILMEGGWSGNNGPVSPDSLTFPHCPQALCHPFLLHQL